MTRCSCIASSSADCVFGVARLISSASTRLLKIGPCWNRKRRSPPSSTMMFVPMMSAGIRSGVNWMREKPRSSASAMVRTSIVLPSPGTPSSSACEPAIRLISVCRTSWCCPTMYAPTSVSMRVAISAKRSGASSSVAGAVAVVVGSVIG